MIWFALSRASISIPSNPHDKPPLYKGDASMKIGLFSDTFYPEINGVATSILSLHRELTRRGHEVHVFAP